MSTDTNASTQSYVYVVRDAATGNLTPRGITISSLDDGTRIVIKTYNDTIVNDPVNKDVSFEPYLAETDLNDYYHLKDEGKAPWKQFPLGQTANGDTSVIKLKPGKWENYHTIRNESFKYTHDHESQLKSPYCLPQPIRKKVADTKVQANHRTSESYRYAILSEADLDTSQLSEVGKTSTGAQIFKGASFLYKGKAPSWRPWTGIPTALSPTDEQQQKMWQIIKRISVDDTSTPTLVNAEGMSQPVESPDLGEKKSWNSDDREKWCWKVGDEERFYVSPLSTIF
ncbi:uncharacterized protein I206_100931 [Kwoniella pini CBS 10737]|uniref:Uncharacterized protein n=1 Tax=Kwoniella pini CBS 10737 TaxID=1296096 RepID=A0A1B9ICD6_9TREE|nr:uncharacterized protein I206_00395 [Kwoniella pini CBS 10737]OCF53094.1 hypothetical protein I206_00395 [Kwoniella pini CBS 10737]